MKDPRIDQLAKLLVNFSCRIKKGEKVLVQVFDTSLDLVEALVNAIYQAGGYPFVDINYNKLLRTFMKNASQASLSAYKELKLFEMQQMHAFIGIRGIGNAKELIDIDPDKKQLYQKEYYKPVHLDQRVVHTRWVVLRYPTPGMAMMANMSTEAFEDFFFKVTTEVDYEKMEKSMQPLVTFLENAEQVHIKGPRTDLSFSIKGIGAVKCSGSLNIPDGEVYTCPVRESVNGTIYYNAPSEFHGFTFRDIQFTFKDGKIIEATANDTDKLNQILDTDEGARYIGEFALGCNPMITYPIGDTLFDEKIAGSFHFTPGNAYDQVTDNGNRSAIHWDLVSIQTPEFGGGEIWIDQQLIRKDGIFVHDAFYGLNPEHLILKSD